MGSVVVVCLASLFCGGSVVELLSCSGEVMRQDEVYVR